MRLLVTGAAGFLGRSVVAEAIQRGHQVHAMVRPATDVSALAWHDDPAVTLVRADLRSKNGLAEAVKDADAVIHLAAAVGGDLYTQLMGTVVATENLLDAMCETGVKRLIAISSFSVYSYIDKWSHTVLKETTPIEPRLKERDDYCLTKVMQENLVREYADREGLQLTVLRPGIIYGRDNLWTACLGAQAGERWWIRIGAGAKLPLTYVENCADAIVLAAEKQEAIGQTFNIVDNRCPSHRTYIRLLRKRLSPSPRVIPVPWTLMRAICRMAWIANRMFFKGDGKLPSILVPARMHARCKPLRYSNARLRKTLGWSPRYSLRDALDRSFSVPVLREEAHQESEASA
ncbi:MAG: NAD-dependent epimerase/dehydratase family protein [Candidatus Hydrogenedentes bacterium]|nr:NAD-dependent epimerase/dehydratase family protein [Candidatus Hydrogenedentota bacterium]